MLKPTKLYRNTKVKNDKTAHSARFDKILFWLNILIAKR